MPKKILALSVAAAAIIILAGIAVKTSLENDTNEGNTSAPDHLVSISIFI